MKTASKLKHLPQAQGLNENQDFLWILAYNVSHYHRPLTKTEEVWIAIYSTAGTLLLFSLVALSLAFKYRKKLPFFKEKEQTFQRTYKTYKRPSRPSISFPHAGGRSLDDLTSSDETLTSHLTNPRVLNNNPFITPARVRENRFQGYQATVRRPSFRPHLVDVVVTQADVHQADQVVPVANHVDKLEESQI